VKVLDLTQFYSPVSGGVKRYVGEKAAYVREQTGNDQHVLVIPGERDGVERGERTRVYTIGSPLISRTSRYRALLRLEAVEHILETERPDIIESGDPYQVAWKAVASGKALRIPVVGFYHSHFAEAYVRSVTKFFGASLGEFMMETARGYTRALYSRFARTLVPSPALANVLREWGVENVVPVDLGVNTGILRPEPDDRAETRREMGVASSNQLSVISGGADNAALITPPIVLLYVGRLAPEKNTRTLVEAFRILHNAGPGRFHLLVVGDGQQRRLVGDLRDETGAVTWQPVHTEAWQLARIYRAADLFVHPGVQETFGLVAIESQACGTPVVGIRGSYMDRIIHNDATLWAEENSPAALAAAIQQMSALDLRAVGGPAARLVAERYSWRVVFDRLFAIYREVCGA
jgi:alpha-1,6-mannosyltransferase